VYNDKPHVGCYFFNGLLTAASDNPQSRVASSLWLEKVGPQAQRYNYTFTHLPFWEDSSTAASTRWFFKPSSKVGWTGLPSTQAFTKSATT
jgi:hypothetical protein